MSLLSGQKECADDNNSPFISTVDFAAHLEKYLLRLSAVLYQMMFVKKSQLLPIMITSLR